MMTFLPWTSLEQFYTQVMVTFIPWALLEQFLNPTHNNIYSVAIT